MENFAVLFMLAIAQMPLPAITLNTTDEKTVYVIDFYNSNLFVPRVSLSLEDFLNHACSACYVNLPLVAFKNEKQLYKYNNMSGYLFDEKDIKYASRNMYKNSSSELYLSLKENYVTFWTDCCQSAENCSETMGSHMDETYTCKPVWDGLRCWSDPKESEQICPSFYRGNILEKPSLCRRTVRKFCTAGRWSITYDFCPSKEYYRLYSNDSTAVDDKCCMTELSISLSYEAYKLYTCGKCYVYIKLTDPKNVLRFYPGDGRLCKETCYNDPDYGRVCNRSCNYADLEGNTTDIEATLGSKNNITRWKDCCRAAVRCCDSMLTTKPPTDLGNFCPATFDGYTCFGYTKAGEVSRQLCPYYMFRDAKTEQPCVGRSEKICLKNGKWDFSLRNGREFTLYDCLNEGFETEEKFSLALYCVSLIFLCAALIPFFYYRQLRVHRITVHKNLFISLAFACFFIIIQKRFVRLDIIYKYSNYNQTVVYNNGPGCKILQVLFEYFQLASHCWMLCEGFYLHKLITSAFSEQKNLMLFYIIGWGIPFVPVTIFAITTKVVSDTKCWIDFSHANWVLYVPSMICLVVNFLFLCNIIRVLITKLRSVQSNEPSYFRKTVRATLILLPLLGVHQLVMGYNPPYPITCTERHKYAMFKNTVLSLEGFIISFLFCYLNGEVLFLIKRSYEKFLLRHGLCNVDTRSRPSISTQVSSVADGGGHFATTRA